MRLAQLFQNDLLGLIEVPVVVAQVGPAAARRLHGQERSLGVLLHRAKRGAFFSVASV